ncbi:DUF5316 family protein [Enterococcus canis]|nr:DUF5316 family protein [Enterococcus canis]
MKYLLTVFAATVVAGALHLFGLASLNRTLGLVLLVLGLILSGTLVSGNQQRANYYQDQQAPARPKLSYVLVLCCALPFLIISFFR